MYALRKKHSSIHSYLKTIWCFVASLFLLRPRVSNDFISTTITRFSLEPFQGIFLCGRACPGGCSGESRRPMKGRREEELSPSSENRLGAAIRARRRRQGMSLTQLAIQVGFGANGRSYISHIEHGRIQHLGEDRLKRIVAALHLPDVDHLLSPSPEAPEESSSDNLDDGIIGATILLSVCAERSLDWARLQLQLATFYYQWAIVAPTTIAKYQALARARACTQHSLQVFTSAKTRASFQEATQLDQKINTALDPLIIAGSQALLKRFSPHSFDWARIQFLRAKFFHQQAGRLEQPSARSALLRARECIEAALPVFERNPAPRSLSEARHLYEQILVALEDRGGQAKDLD